MSGVQDKWLFHVFIGDVDLKRKEAKKKVGDFYLLSLWTFHNETIIGWQRMTIRIIHDSNKEEISKET